MKPAAFVLLASASLLAAGCGIITAPFTLPAAVSENANFNFKGKVVDNAGQTLDGVIVVLNNTHRVWAPLEVTTDHEVSLPRRVDGSFAFEARGAECQFTFSKDGFQDANFHFQAYKPSEVSTDDGIWRMNDSFPVVLLKSRSPDAPLIHHKTNISYADYPIANAVALINLATNGAAGDVIYSEKNAEDPTVFPPGVLYATLDQEPPAAINAKGDIDQTELDIPHFFMLHLPGAGNGFIRIEPRTGFYPLRTSDLAPASGYNSVLTFTRPRLKEMRSVDTTYIVEANEYFFFRAAPYFGKGKLSWATRSGKPSFEFDLYIQPEPENRDLATHTLPK